MPPALSVVVPAYNAERLLDRCLASLAASRYQDFEVVVVDDASTDATAEVARAAGARVVRLEKNSGPARARNVGARAASGEVLFFADSDVEFQPETLGEMARAFEDPERTVATGIYAAEPVNPGAAPLYKALFMYFHFTKAPIAHYGIFNAACGAVRRKAFLEIGGFNESIAWGLDLENDELGKRLGAKYVNPVLTGVQVRHNFPPLGALLRVMFRRTHTWTLYFLKHKQFDATITTPLMGAANAAAPGVLAGILLAPVHPAFAASALGLALVYLAGYTDFYRFVLRERPPRDFPSVAGVAYLVSVSVGLGALAAFARKLVGSCLNKDTLHELRTTA